MSWKTAYRSFYYDGAPEPEDMVLPAGETALLVIDVQNTYLEPHDDPRERERWAPFVERMNATVIPNIRSLIETCRGRGIEVVFARIACLKQDGKDRSLSQKKPGVELSSAAERHRGVPTGPGADPPGRRYRRLQDDRQRPDRDQPAAAPAQYGHPPRYRDRDLYRSMRLLHGPQPGRRELQRRRRRGLLCRGHRRAARSGAGDHQHDLLAMWRPWRKR